MALTLNIVRQKIEIAQTRVTEFTKIVRNSTDEDEKRFYIDLIQSYNQMIIKGERCIKQLNEPLMRNKVN